MAGGSYIDPYPRDESCKKHTEDVAIICSPSTRCFGEPAPNFVRRVCDNVRDYGNTIETRESENAIDLLKQSCPNRGDSREAQRNAEKMLLTHSLWLIDHQTLLDSDFWTSLCYQVRNLPDESEVCTWISEDHEDVESLRSEITSQFGKIRVATSQDQLERLVSGYIGFQVNPNGSEQTVIEWSHKVADKIDDIG